MSDRSDKKFWVIVIPEDQNEMLCRIAEFRINPDSEIQDDCRQVGMQFQDEEGMRAELEDLGRLDAFDELSTRLMAAELGGFTSPPRSPSKTPPDADLPPSDGFSDGLMEAPSPSNPVVGATVEAPVNKPPTLLVSHTGSGLPVAAPGSPLSMVPDLTASSDFDDAEFGAGGVIDTSAGDADEVPSLPGSLSLPGDSSLIGSETTRPGSRFASDLSDVPPSAPSRPAAGPAPVEPRWCLAIRSVALTAGDPGPEDIFLLPSGTSMPDGAEYFFYSKAPFDRNRMLVDQIVNGIRNMGEDWVARNGTRDELLGTIETLYRAGGSVEPYPAASQRYWLSIDRMTGKWTVSHDIGKEPEVPMHQHSLSWRGVEHLIAEEKLGEPLIRQIHLSRRRLEGPSEDQDWILIVTPTGIGPEMVPADLHLLKDGREVPKGFRPFFPEGGPGRWEEIRYQVQEADLRWLDICPGWRDGETLRTSLVGHVYEMAVMADLQPEPTPARVRGPRTRGPEPVEPAAVALVEVAPPGEPSSPEGANDTDDGSEDFFRRDTPPSPPETDDVADWNANKAAARRAVGLALAACAAALLLLYGGIRIMRGDPMVPQMASIAEAEREQPEMVEMDEPAVVRATSQLVRTPSGVREAVQRLDGALASLQGDMTPQDRQSVEDHLNWLRDQGLVVLIEEGTTLQEQLRVVDSSANEQLLTELEGLRERIGRDREHAAGLRASRDALRRQLAERPDPEPSPARSTPAVARAEEPRPQAPAQDQVAAQAATSTAPVALYGTAEAVLHQQTDPLSNL